MDGPGRNIPGAEALGDFDVSDLRGRSSLGELRDLTPSTESYADLIPQAPPVAPPPWWKNPGTAAAPGDPSVVPSAGISAGAQWVRDNLGPSSVQWWARDNATVIPNAAQTALNVGQDYKVPSGQALGILNVTPTLYTVTGIQGLGSEVDPFAVAFMASFRLKIAGRSALDSEHIAPAFGGSTNNRWDTSIFNRPMFWGDSSVRVPFTLYAREGELVQFELLGSSNFSQMYTALSAPTGIFCGYRAIGVLIPMSYLF